MGANRRAGLVALSVVLTLASHRFSRVDLADLVDVFFILIWRAVFWPVFFRGLGRAFWLGRMFPNGAGRCERCALFMLLLVFKCWASFWNGMRSPISRCHYFCPFFVANGGRSGVAWASLILSKFCRPRFLDARFRLVAVFFLNRRSGGRRQ